MNLGRSVVRGVTWAYVSHFGGKLLTFATTAVLARLLVPEEFGVIAFALVVLGLVNVLRDFGFKDALIYLEASPEDTADAAFYLNLCSGAVFCVLILLLAPFATHFIDDPRIVPILQWMAPAVLIDSLSVTHEGLLQKRLLFRQRFVVDICAIVVKSGVTIVLALSGLNVWSLVIGHLAGAVTRTIGRWYWLDWRPRLNWVAERAAALWQYGRHIFALRVIGVFVDRADQIMVAFLLGEAQLAFFFIAGRVAEILISSIYQVITMVIFPVFAKLRQNREQLIRTFFKTTQICAMVSFPFGFGACVVAPELIVVLFGDAWAQSAPLLRIVTLTGIATTLPWSAGDLVKAMGRPDINTKFLAIEALYMLPIVWFVAFHTRDALLTASASLACILFAGLCRMIYVSWFAGLRYDFYLRALRGPLLSSLMMIAAVMLWRSYLSNVSDLTNLASSVVVGALSYTTMLWLLEKREIVELFKTIRESTHSA